MPYLDELMIGSFAGGVGGMVAVSSLGESEYSPRIAEGAFTVDPVHYSQVIQLADGSVLEKGWLETSWHINGLKASQYDDVIAFRDSLTTKLYIRTLDNDGVTYKNFLCDAIFPVKPNRADPTAVEEGPVYDFEIRFIKLLEQI